MSEKKVSSFEIIRHGSFSWSYVYMVDNKKRDIHGDSLHDLRRKVLSRDLPWDDENYPEEKIAKTQYDSIKIEKVPINNSYQEQYNDETYDYEKSGALSSWTPSMKKWNRDKRDRY